MLCAGLIGWRSLRFAGNAKTLGLYGFGAAAHIIVQAARKQGRQVFAFTRQGDTASQAFALRLGAAWAGSSAETPPEPLDAAIIYAPVGELVPAALAAVRKGGVVVCAGIHMSDIPSFPYRLLWEERQIISVANLTRQDGLEFLAFATEAGIETQIKTYPLDQANSALADLRAGQVGGRGRVAASAMLSIRVSQECRSRCLQSAPRHPRDASPSLQLSVVPAPTRRPPWHPRHPLCVFNTLYQLVNGRFEP